MVESAKADNASPAEGRRLTNPSYYTYSGFFGEAEGMHYQLMEHFAQSQTYTVDNFIWNYWFVPDTYAYLTAEPSKIFTPPMLDGFCAHLKRFCFLTFGLRYVFSPRLSMYVNGCYQQLHNDARNGRLAYIFSLTDWDRRSFRGGETLLMHEKNYFGTAAMTGKASPQQFYSLIPSHFNQLLVFDDRIPHAVPAIEGNMNPQESRIVLHGHMREEGWEVEGALSRDSAEPEIEPVYEYAKFYNDGSFDGILTLRFITSPEGKVLQVTSLLNRVLSMRSGITFDMPLQNIVRKLTEINFPAAQGQSVFTLPFCFGEKLV